MVFGIQINQIISSGFLVEKKSTRFLDQFIGKNEVSAENLTYFFFIVAKFHVKTGEKMVDFILRFLGIKNETG